ncbi:MAG: tRNA guanosine(34) transglycosylase Tgt [Rhodospirillaceae bacterium]|nr:tRNA guanosine(34) transglycosylase Tgt [Rhodospirillaceae bacterium]
MSDIKFEISATDGKARRGKLELAHGVVNTPAFMPVGTAATVKSMLPENVAQTGAEIILGNTYHLMLRPGAERIAKLGGLHKFMNWSGPILTDSGGYQVMSLSELRKLDENGVTFRSHIDGSYHTLTPERSVEVQHLLGADITMCFDECPPFPCEKDEVARAAELSVRWAQRSKDAFVPRPGHALFGINQGGVHADLREQNAKELIDIGFDGYAVGGLAVGEGREKMFAALDVTVPHLPDDRPRYLMGVGKPQDIVGAVMRGIDMFDCVLPTRSGRTGQGFTTYGPINIKNSRHKDDPRPIDEHCNCPACTRFSRAYLHHLFKAGEMLGPMLLSRHNIHFYQNMMQGLRDAIADQRLSAYAKTFRENYSRGDIEPL